MPIETLAHDAMGRPEAEQERAAAVEAREASDKAARDARGARVAKASWAPAKAKEAKELEGNALEAEALAQEAEAAFEILKPFEGEPAAYGRAMAQGRLRRSGEEIQSSLEQVPLVRSQW